MKKTNLFVSCAIAIMILGVSSISSAEQQSRRQSHTCTYCTETEQLDPDDNRNGTTNEAGDQRPLFYFDETSQECVDTTGIDTDEDGVGDGCDNCVYIANPGQEETEGVGTGGDACDGDMFKQAAETTPPATPDEGGEEGGGETQPTPGAGFLADEGGSCTLVPGSANAAASSILLLVAMSIAILTIRRKVVD